MNLSRFRDGGKRSAKEARELAHAHYHRVMRDTFRECWRVLRDDGVLTVMFTHKAQEAWHALLEPLFGIEPPDWTPQPPEQPTLPGASWEGEEEEGEET